LLSPRSFSFFFFLFFLFPNLILSCFLVFLFSFFFFFLTGPVKDIPAHLKICSFEQLKTYLAQLEKNVANLSELVKVCFFVFPFWTLRFREDF